MDDVFTRSTSKVGYGEHEFSQTAVAMESFAVMAKFLGLEQPCAFTASDRDSMIRDLDALAQIVGQMDSGQRGNGISFDRVPHSMVRVCVGAMRLLLSGRLESIDIDDGMTKWKELKDGNHYAKVDGLCIEYFCHTMKRTNVDVYFCREDSCLYFVRDGNLEKVGENQRFTFYE